jgi:hypothetical protein
MMDDKFLNKIFKETMDKMGVQPSVLAEKAARTRNNISDIRGGKSFPNLRDFVHLLNACEEIKPGFIEVYVRLILGESRRQSLKPEELIDSLEPAEIGALLHALGSKMADSRKVRSEKQELLLTV